MNWSHLQMEFALKKVIPFLLFLYSLQVLAAGSVDVKVVLTLGTSFTISTSDVQGSVTKAGDGFQASSIVVQLKNIKTGIALRDSHTLKHLEAEKYPDVKLITAEGKSGEGKGSIEIKGIKKDIKGTYKVDGTNLIADFDLNIKDFKIENVRYMGVGVKDIVHVTAKIPIK